jgi:hypothetical protein
VIGCEVGERFLFDEEILLSYEVVPRIRICTKSFLKCSLLFLKGHGNEADFLGFFCRNLFLMDPLHYLSSRSDFGFEFAEIFVIEKRLPDSAIRRVGDSPLGESGSRRLSDSASRGVDDSPTW